MDLCTRMTFCYLLIGTEFKKKSQMEEVVNSVKGNKSKISKLKSSIFNGCEVCYG